MHGPALDCVLDRFCAQQLFVATNDSGEWQNLQDLGSHLCWVLVDLRLHDGLAKIKTKKTRTAPPSPNRISEFFRKMTDSTPRLRTASAPGSRSDSPGGGGAEGGMLGASAKLPMVAGQELQMTKTPANRYSLLPPLDQSGVALTPDLTGKVQQLVDKFQRMEQIRDRLGRGRDRSKDLSQGPVTGENLGQKVQELEQIFDQLNESDQASLSDGWCPDFIFR